MKILTAEISLREETRTIEQAKPQLTSDRFGEQAQSLALTQTELLERTNHVIEMIRELPEGQRQFAKEIVQISNAASAMSDAKSQLQSPHTGAEAIAAETDAIEWLLRAKKSGPGSGSDGGDPGEGNRSGADLATSALALLGESKEKQAVTVERDTNQATGKSGRDLPDEFRVGLDRYFEALDSERSVIQK